MGGGKCGRRGWREEQSLLRMYGTPGDERTINGRRSGVELGILMVLGILAVLLGLLVLGILTVTREILLRERALERAF